MIYMIRILSVKIEWYRVEEICLLTKRKKNMYHINILRNAYGPDKFETFPVVIKFYNSMKTEEILVNQVFFTE